MMIAWFPLLKLAVSLALLWWALRPLVRHFKNHKAEGGPESPLPTDPKAYWRLGLVVVLIALTPMKLAPGRQSEMVIQTFDTPAHTEVPVIEAKPRAQYEAPNNQETIKNIMD